MIKQGKLALLIAVFWLFIPQALVSWAALVLDDSLQGATRGTRSGGAFVTGGWQVTNKDDTIYWHVPTISKGAAEWDVQGLYPNECRTGMEDKVELFHMYDHTIGDSDINYNGGYRDNPFKHFVRKIDCLSPGKIDAMELVWKIETNYVEPDSQVLSWDASRTYRFREVWEPDGSGNTVMRSYRDGVLLVTMTVPGAWRPAGHSVRIAASPRRAADAGAPIGAIFSNIKVWDLTITTPSAPTITQPASDAVVNTPLVCLQWRGDPHARYQARVNRVSDPNSGIVWDSGDVVSSRDHAWTGPLPDATRYFVYARLGDVTNWGPWNATGAVFRVDTAAPVTNANLVRVQGNSLCDNRGPFLGLGASYFQALRRAKYDRSRLNSDLAFLATNKFKFVRVLSMVGWYEAWQGLEIAPVTFTNRAGTQVAAWPDYWQQFREMIDIIYSHGLRVQVTVFADAQLMPNKTDRLNHLNAILQNLARREHKIALLEVANEAWQNGFPGSQGIADLREFAQYLADRTSIPVAITSNDDTSDQGIISLYNGSAADLATVHFSRDIGTVEGGWLPVRDCYRAGNLSGAPPVSSNEPIGPGSSVSSENDPIKLVMAAAFAWTANLPIYVYHTSAGVFGQTTFQNMAGARDFVHLENLLPPDLPGWVRNDGKEAAAPFTAFANGQSNAWWPEITGATNGVVRNIGATKAAEFVALPVGILNGGVELEARRPMKFRVYHPLTGAMVTNLSLGAGARFTLPRGPGAYLIRGLFQDRGTPLVPRGALWKYLDDGSNQDTLWRGNSFNDSAWASGAAQLGYGEGDETTQVSFGPSDTNKHTTTYFRRSFPVINPLAFTNLSLRLLRDDGAIVYLNGMEIFRSNMPTGQVTHTTFADTVASDADENTFFTTNLSPALLVNGMNVLAVEVHQVNLTSSDLSFDLELLGLGNAPPVVYISHPDLDTRFPQPGSIAIVASAFDSEGGVSKVDFFINDYKLGEDWTAPFSLLCTNVPAGDYRLTVLATDDGGRSTMSAGVKVTVRELLVAAGSPWKYLDTGADPGATWRTRSFNDSAWPSGPAQLGFGDGDEATLIADHRQITTYFRHAFAITDPANFTNLTLSVLRDDGAIVYLNNAEVFRSNMPTGQVTYSTFADLVVAGDEETTFFTTNISANWLAAGTNIIAVEIHQANTNSTDVSFDLELIAYACPSAPQLNAARAGKMVVLSWPAAIANFGLQTASDLLSPYWLDVPPQLVSNAFTLTADSTLSPQQYFRLKKLW